jgi:hypothetical protein
LLWFWKYFRSFFRWKNWRFWLKTKVNYAKFDHNIGFWENANVFAENFRKSQKIVIITTTPVRQSLGLNQGSMLWSQFSAIFANFL